MYYMALYLVEKLDSNTAGTFKFFLLVHRPLM